MFWRKSAGETSPVTITSYVPVAAWKQRVVVSALPILLATLSGCDTTPPKMLTGADVSPNTANGVAADGGAQPAGVIPILAGNDSVVYAVSMYAGVWRSIKGRSWVQLANSPSRAYSIAVDPRDSTHIAVGERNGDHKDTTKNTSGVHQSYD